MCKVLRKPATLCSVGRTGNAYKVQEDSKVSHWRQGASAIEMRISADLKKVWVWVKARARTQLLCCVC